MPDKYSNIIDITQRLRRKRHDKQKPVTKAGADLDTQQPFDLTHTRRKQIENERREARRTVLEGFVGAAVVVPQKGLVNVVLHDISKTGLAFDMGLENGVFHANETINLRIYVNHKTYFGFSAQVEHIKKESGRARLGARFCNNQTQSQALIGFVNFLEHVVKELKTDSGDPVAL